MMEDFMKRINQQREQEALLVAQREQELREQEQSAQEKEEFSPKLVFRQLIKEMCGTKVCEEQKQKMEDTMLDLLEDCREKELYCIHNNVDDLIKNKVIKSSVENLVPIPSESEDFSDNESECDMPVCDDFKTFSNPLFDSNDDFTSSYDKSLSNEDVPKENFKMYSNPLFDDEEIISTKIDPHSFNVESNLIESLLNRDTLIDSSPKFDYLFEEFSGELAHIDLIPPGIEEADYDLEEEIRLVENFSYDNSSLRLPEERNYENVDTIIESPSPSPIPVEDSDSHMKEINLFLASDDSMPLGIENEDYDSEGDIRFLEELLSNDPIPLLEIESSNLDHFNDPSSPCPPLEPPDVEICFDVEPDTTVKNDFDELNEDECFDPGGSKGRTVADSIAERLTRPTAYKFKTDCSIIPVWRTRLIVESIHIKFYEIKEMSKTSVDNNTSGLVLQRQKASDYENSGPALQIQNVSSLADTTAPS
ncbi:hypothetical protein Tco_1000407 [Tanacetum coccineum]